MQKGFQSLSIPKLPTLTTEEGIKQIKSQIHLLENWKKIEELIPDLFLKNKNMKKTGLAGIFAASLELTKEGVITIMQKKVFENLMIKKNN